MIGDQHWCKNGVVENEKLNKQKKKVNHYVCYTQHIFLCYSAGDTTKLWDVINWYIK